MSQKIMRITPRELRQIADSMDKCFRDRMEAAREAGNELKPFEIYVGWGNGSFCWPVLFPEKEREDKDWWEDISE